jgi:hypothetical protein
MLNDQDQQADNFADLPKKSYSAMKVSQLGDLAGMTEGMVMGGYGDGMSMTMM